MGRSLKKGLYVVERLLEKVYRADTSGSREPIKTWARAQHRSCPSSLARTFAIHNGRNFIKLYVTEDMVGHKLGEVRADPDLQRPRRQIDHARKQSPNNRVGNRP